MFRPQIITIMIGLSGFFLGTAAQNSPTQKLGGQVDPYQSIENKASLVKPDDPNSIRALADEVFNLPRVFPRMPSLIETTVKSRLVQAEISYREGKRPGVREEDVVRMLNDLAEQFGAPPHARTTLSQLRILRMWLALSQPRFMGEGIALQNPSVGESISPMAPLQATHLISTLIDQKFTNPDFQVTPQEWEEVSMQRVTEKIHAAQARVAEAKATGRPTATLKVTTFSSEPMRQMEQTIYPRISSMSITEGLNLLDQVLAKLRID